MTDGEPTPQPQTPPANPPGQQQGEGEQRFTQADVDKIVGERAKRAAEAAVNKLLADLGYDSPDTLKKDTAEARKRREAEMSEVEKAQREVDEARKQAEAFKTQMEQERQQRITDRRNSAIEAAAQRARAEAPRDVLLWAQEYARDTLAKTINEDGSINDKEVAALIDACREQRKGWFTGSAPGSPSNADGKLPKPDLKKLVGERPFGNL